MYPLKKPSHYDSSLIKASSRSEKKDKKKKGLRTPSFLKSKKDKKSKKEKV